MLNIGELESCIDECGRQINDYRRMIDTLKVSKCAKHPKVEQRICSDCLRVICVNCEGLRGCMCQIDPDYSDGPNEDGR